MRVTITSPNSPGNDGSEMEELNDPEDTESQPMVLTIADDASGRYGYLQVK